MATCNFIPERQQSKGSMRCVMRYVTQDSKTIDKDGIQYVSGVNCIGTIAYCEFLSTKNLYGKMSGSYFQHYDQSFPPGEKISYREAHQIGIETAKIMFPGYEVLVVTHLDATYNGVQRIHNHFIVNSVSHENGMKLHLGPYAIEKIRRISDQVCRAHQLSVLPEYRETFDSDPVGSREYRAASKGESWKFQCIVDIEKTMEVAASKEDFIVIMTAAGYAVSWEDARKYIMYTCPNGKKVRDVRLHERKFYKENMIHEFAIRQAAIDRQFDSCAAEGLHAIGDTSDNGYPLSTHCVRDTARSPASDLRIYEGNGQLLSGNAQQVRGSEITSVDTGSLGLDGEPNRTTNERFESQCKRSIERCDTGCATSTGTEPENHFTGWDEARAIFLSIRNRVAQSSQNVFPNEEMDDRFNAGNSPDLGDLCRNYLSFDDEVKHPFDGTDTSEINTVEHPSNVQFHSQSECSWSTNEKKKNQKLDYEYIP